MRFTECRINIFCWLGTLRILTLITPALNFISHRKSLTDLPKNLHKEYTIRQLPMGTGQYTEFLILLSSLFLFRSFATFRINKYLNKVWFFRCSIYTHKVFLT